MVLEEGSILYVMFRESDNDIGHSMIIKGYWRLGDDARFVVSDPEYNTIGLFGYPGYTKDAQLILADMERHASRYYYTCRMSRSITNGGTNYPLNVLFVIDSVL